MSNYILRGDPGLSGATKQRNWTLFLKALEVTTPEIVTSLRKNPLDACRAFAVQYAKISTHKFGALVCEWDGRPALAARPLEDLAVLICSPERGKPNNPWPPSAPYWEPALRTELLDLSIAMREWAANFQSPGESKRVPHWRIVDAGLESMRTWLQEPETMSVDHWWYLAEAIASNWLEPSQNTITIKGWNPIANETEVEFRARVKKLTDHLNQWAKKEISSIKSLLVKFDTKRNPDHFHWAALRLVRQLTYPEITQAWANTRPDDPTAADLDEGTVRKGVKATLKALDLVDLPVNRK